MQEAVNVLANLPLQNIANIIILISAVIIAGKNIYNFIKKPVDDLQQKADKAEEVHIEKVLKREMPSLMEKNCQTIVNAIDGLKVMVQGQEEQLNEISSRLELLNASQLDMLRYDMNKLYYKYRPYKKMLSADKKAFMKLYHDYKLMDGNTWIDALYSEVKDWPIVEDESELKT